jgi:mannan endo-1,4-beta-mannosidase
MGYNIPDIIRKPDLLGIPSLHWRNMVSKWRSIALLMLATTLLASACGLGTRLPASLTPSLTTGLSQNPTSDKFVTVSDGKFILAGQPYYFIGANFWEGMNLGVDGPSGNRNLLLHDLDDLQKLGVTNLRVMAASEGPDSEPHRMVPALMESPGEYNLSVLDGLDYLLSEMGTRGMKAVMVLNNYWQWSGGMAQYVSWHEKSPIPYPGDYGIFMDYVSEFYACDECQTWYRDHIEAMIEHFNPYTGLKYRDDSTIFSWELANEPRRYPLSWINDTAAFIKSLDPNHMVTTGSEGTPPGENQNFIETHKGTDIDYSTIHIWPQNWGWYNPQSPSTFQTGVKRAITYFKKHAVESATLGKPMVLEEFGLARDWNPLNDIYNPNSATTYRDQFYTAMFDEVTTAISLGEPVGGANFWAWAGGARPGYPWIGDPPHETAGWYSVYDTDSTTMEIIFDYAVKMANLEK